MKIEPLLIDLEGDDGSGKTTVIARLAKEPEFADDVFTREPGGTILGERLRAVLKDKTVRRSAWAETFTFMAARSELIDEVVLPALLAGRRAFLDRYFTSTLAYQWGAQMGHEDPTEFMRLPKIAGMPFPGLVLWYDLDPAIAMTRRPQQESAHDHFDARELDFHQRVCDSYRRLFTTYEPWKTVVRRIDAAQPPDAVYADTLVAIRDYLRTHA
ncbi:MAG: dTMP kinase [Candidatus Kerfeldbacteria bacterium]|nr:dTMP kinase [Candidatus Kerfeldbacteria bacterium]